MTWRKRWNWLDRDREWRSGRRRGEKLRGVVGGRFGKVRMKEWRDGGKDNAEEEKMRANDLRGGGIEK